jgi:phospholipase C
MRRRGIVAASLLISMAALGLWITTARADGGHPGGNRGLQNVNHIIIVMQENHSFDNYFGALPYVPGGPYHQCRSRGHEGNSARTSDMGGGGGGEGGGDGGNDNQCVDGLTCRVDSSGNFKCANSNLDDDGSIVTAFHEQKFCTGPDLDHSWSGSHIEANFNDPAAALFFSPNDGFVLRNDMTTQGQPDNGPETANSDDTMGFYTQADLPFYYNLAENFAIDDRFFCSVIGQTFPNRAYEVAATSFGHLTTSEILPPPGGYKPITGTIYDLLDANNVTWTNYFSDVPLSGIFRPTAFPFTNPPHVLPISMFLTQAAAGTLPSVSFVDPNLGFVFGPSTENDEHPPTDIRKGEAFVSQVVNAVRSGPNWKDSIILITYDEHGGFYDHVAPAPAPQGGELNPDGIDPGQCADLSNPPMSETPGNGAQCTVSRMEALAICAAFTDFGAYPRDCANFDQLGFRVPFIAVSPFSKPHYVSHTVGDHTSMLALIEERFLSTSHHGFFGDHLSMTERDENADPLLDMFDFQNSPSLNTPVTTAPAASPTDPGCPFVPGPQG